MKNTAGKFAIPQDVNPGYGAYYPDDIMEVEDRNCYYAGPLDP